MPGGDDAMIDTSPVAGSPRSEHSRERGEQAQDAGLLDGLVAAVHAELGVQVAHPDG
jgi:hypothetical protein